MSGKSHNIRKIIFAFALRNAVRNLWHEQFSGLKLIDERQNWRNYQSDDVILLARPFSGVMLFDHELKELLLCINSLHHIYIKFHYLSFIEAAASYCVPNTWLST